MMVFLLVGGILKDLKINTINRMSKPFNIHEWQAKQRLAEQRADWTPPPMGMSPEEEYEMRRDVSSKSSESMSNADIRALQTVVSDYSLNKVLNTIAVIADKTGKHDEADMIQKLASQIAILEDPRMDPAIRSDFDDPIMDEQNTTGTGASFQAGSGEGYATPNAFGDDKKKKMKAYKSIGYKRI
jgi:hypothetical protein